MARGKQHKDHKKTSNTEKKTPAWQQKTEQILNSKTIMIILLIIPIFFALFFRLYPTTLPITDDWAENTIQNQIISQAEAQIRTNYPLLSSQQLRAQAIQQYNNYAEQNKEELTTQTAQLSQGFKERLQTTLEKNDGTTYEQTYLIAIDPYYYLRRAENILEDGDVCDTINEEGDCIDNRMLAPVGVKTNPDYHSAVEAGMGTIAGWFGYQPITGAFFLPAIFAALATIPAFFIVKRRYGSFAGSIAGLIVGLHAVFLGRTPAGFADTDVWNVFFPLYIALLFLVSLDRTDKRSYMYMGAAALLTGLYSEFWAGWYFTFFILTAVLIGSLTFSAIRWIIAIKHSKTLKERTKELKHYVTHTAIQTGIYIAITGIIVSLFSGARAFINAFTQPFTASVGLQNPVVETLWPNVLTTVAELNVQSLGGIIGQLGGRLLVILAIIGAFVALVKEKETTWKHYAIGGGIILYYLLMTTTKMMNFSASIFGIWPFNQFQAVYIYFLIFSLPMIALLVLALFRKERVNVHTGLFMMGWIVATMFATTQGTRFLLLNIPILALTIGFAIGWIKQTVAPLLEQELNINNLISKTIIIAVTILVLFTPVHANLFGIAHNVGKQEVPSMNDAWWTSLRAIHDDSQPDAIITSWWDFGHWFKYVSERRVTFDGASQTTPNAHWVGKIFQTPNETEAVGILRMLNCGQNNAFDTIREKTGSSLIAYQTTTALIGISKQEAQELLYEQDYNNEEINTILSNTHCEPPESYVIVSQDMIGKAGVWGHFGLWDFEKAYAVRATQDLPRDEAIAAMQETLGMGAGQAQQTYTTITTQPDRRAINTWVSPWPSDLGTRNCAQQNDTITCRIGTQIGTQQGVSIIADTLIINTTIPENTTITLTANGQPVGNIQPATLQLDGETYELGGDFGLAIRIKDNTATLTDPQLLGSTFTKLFHEENPGNYFITLTKQTQINGGKIIVYKVDWDAYKESIGEL